MKKFHFPAHLMSVGDYALASCSGLTSINIPATLSTISNSCFYMCSGLVSLTLPATLKTLKSGAFQGCTGLASITINNSFPLDLTQSTYVFYDVNKSTCQLNVPYGTSARFAVANQWSEFKNRVEKTSGIYVSSDKAELLDTPGSSTSLVIKANVAWTASSNESWLTVSPASGTGDNTLTFTSDSTQITFIRKAIITVSAPDCITQTIEVSQKLAPKTVNILAGGLSGALTSSELNSLSTLIVNGTMDARDFKVMRDSMPQLTDLDLSGVSIVAYSGTEGTYPSFLTYSVDVFPQYAFNYLNSETGKISLKTVKLPSTITGIGYYAFTGCSGLRTITIPSKVKTISNNAFYSCTGLMSITIPASINTIANYAFFNCSALTSITLNSSYPVDLSNSSNVFYNVNFTTCSLYVPYGSKSLYEAAVQWSYFTNIVENAKGFLLSTNKVKLSYDAGSSISVDLKANVTWTVSSDQTWLTVDPITGTGDGRLTLTAEANQSSVVRKALVTVSSDSIISQTIEITQNIAPKTVDIKAGGLSSALSANELNSVSALTITGTIDARDFKTMRDNMPLLTDLDLSETSILAYKGYDGTNVYDSISIANTIPVYAFYNNKTGITKKNLKTIKIPSSVSAIGNYAFQNCNALTSFTFPNAVTTIGTYAFFNCTGLTSIYVNSTFPIDLSKTWSTFYNVNQANCILYVPYKAKTLYAAANQWSSFTNIIENTQGFLIGSDKLKLFYEQGTTGTIDISANVNWTVTTDQSWLSVSLDSGSGDRKLTLMVDKNDSTTRRTAKVTVSSPGFGSQVITVTQTGFPKTINITAGGLSTGLTAVELSTTADLIITGTMDARDFKTMRDLMPELARLDLSGASIAAFSGTGGTYDFSTGYSSNAIPPSAFYVYSQNRAKTSLISIKIPSTVSYIGSSAFQSCTGLTSVYINSVYPIDFTNSGDPFYNSNKAGCTLYVPYATKPYYFAATGWKDFMNIVEDTLGFLVESNNVKLRSIEGSSARINVKSNIEWTVSSDQTWLKVQPNVGIGNDSIILTAEINSSAIIRNATVTVSAPGEESQMISVMQTGATIIIDNTAGELHSALTSEKIKNVSELTVKGTIDASDFYFMRDSLPLLTYLDISHAKIVAYLNFYIGQAANIVPWNAFYNQNTSKGKPSLVSIALPLTATGIFDGAFQLCTGLTEISIPYSIKSIGNNSFNSCTSLKAIVLPDSVSSLGESSFANCTKLKSFTIPPLVSSIGVNAFMNCTGLKTINAQPDVPADISKNWGVFYNVDKINCILSVPYGKRTLYMAANQWKDFSNIIEISNGVLLSKNNLKLPNKAVGSISINVISTVSWNVSCDQTWLTVSPQNATGNNTITINVEDNPGIFIRSSIITVSTVGVPSKKIVVTQAATTKVININAGELYSALTSEELRKISDLKINGTIDARDFKTMRDLMPLLTYLDLGEVEVASYNGNQGTLNNANNSYNILYPGNKIPDEAFYRNDYYNFEDNLTTIILPSSITNIGKSAFYIKEKLENITIPNSVTTISERAFSSCTGLQSIHFGSAVSTIGYEAFAACNSITELVFPNSLKSIGNMSFNYCQNLINITFSNSITEITNNAFAFCYSLKSLKLPDSLILIDYGAFYGCKALTNVIFGNSLKTIGYQSFLGCTSLTAVDIPNTVTLIDCDAFSGCNKITDVKMSKSLTKLGCGAFSYCTSLTSIEIPSKVITIGGGVFDFSGIKTIYAYPVNPVVTIPYNEMFGNFDKTTCMLYVPIGSKSAYQKAYEWKDFTHIIEMPTAIPTLNAEEINIYLDPVSGSFSIHGIEGIYTISIYDMNGRAMLCKQVQSNENISISNFPTGMYIIRIITKIGTIEQKVLKN
ncbi:MAG: leucine-rich repeat protein [Paludibacter sp.]|nr:leucine-rich repeat protein [Paludibacter sp.]